MTIELGLEALIAVCTVGYMAGGVFLCWLMERLDLVDYNKMEPPIFLVFISWPLIAITLALIGVMLGLDRVLRWICSRK